MSEPYAFWLAQLAGKNPDSGTVGVPCAGFYLLRQRYSWLREANEHKIGTRRKVATYFWPTSIWQDESGWHCVINRAPQHGRAYSTSHLTDPDVIDEQVFSRCCRSAIKYDDYLAKVKELETSP